MARHHCGAYDKQNDLLLRLVASLNPKYTLVFPTSQYSNWDAKLVGKDGEVKAIIESKIRGFDSWEFNSMLVDDSKRPLIKLSKEAPVFVVQQFLDKTVYLGKLAEDGAICPSIKVEEKKYCKETTAFLNNNYIEKTVYHLYFEDCYKYSVIQAGNKAFLRKERSPIKTSNIKAA